MADIVSQLRLLQCPLAEVDESQLLGERWTDLIAWLLRSYDVELYQKLSLPKAGPTGDLTRDALFSVLAQMASFIGSCAPNDTKLIQGIAKPQQKMEFLKDLLAMLRAKNNESAGKLNLNETYTRDMQLAADIADDQHNIFAPKIQLFPLDMEPIIKTQPNAQKPPISPDQLDVLINEQTAEFERMKAELKALRDETNSYVVPTSLGDTDGSSSQSFEQTKAAVWRQFSKLRSLVPQFERIYKLELLPWATQAKPNLVGLGPAAKQLLDVNERLTHLLKAITSMKQCYTNLTSTSAFSQLIGKNGSSDINEELVYNLKDQIGVLERSIARQREQQEQQKPPQPPTSE